MSLRALSGLSILLSLAVLACGSDSGPISHAPTHLVIVSGANQSGDISAALSTPLVIQALDGAKKAVLTPRRPR